MEYEINLENLVKMKRVFEEADEDGSGELDPDEFYEKLGPYLGQSLSQTQVAQLFMRIDADCGGTIDWQEFIDFFFLQRAATNATDAGSDWRLHTQDLSRKDWRGSSHKETVEQVYCCAPTEQYITGGRGGQLRVWGAQDLRPQQSITVGNAWITDCAYVECPAYKKLVVAAQDRTLRFYDTVRSTFEYSGCLSCSGSMGPPLCLAELEREAGGPQMPRLVWGDTEGAVMQLKADPPPLRIERQMAAKKDFDVLHQGHSDWVTHLQHIPDVGLVSSSLDSTLCMLDLERGKLSNRVTLHKKGVRTFGYSPAFSLVASAGVERSVLLWQPKGNVSRKVGELPGHSAAISQLVVADEQSQVITLTDDNVVRLWDLRNHKCVQTISRADWPRPEDCKPTSMCYDAQRRRLVCASRRPSVWDHRPVDVERQHDSRLVAAMYNSTFSVVVSGDEGGTIVMWDVQSGRREGGFSLHSHPATAAAGKGAGASGLGAGSAAASQKLTAMAFDANQRRLLTATDSGAVRMWNFNSGAVLREFKHHEGSKEISAVAFVKQPEQKGAQELLEGCPTGGGAGMCPEGEQQMPGLPDEHSWADSFAGGTDDSEHAMLHMQQRRQHSAVAPHAGKQRASSEAGGSSRAGGLVLATGWSRNVCVWEEGEQGQASSGYRRLTGHDADVLCMAPLGADVVATGDFEGEVRVWHLPTSTCLAAFSYGGPQFERAVRNLCWLPTAAPTTGTAPLLVASGEDGGLQFWQVQLPVDPHSPSLSCSEPATTLASQLVARIAAAHRRQDCVTAICTDVLGQRLWTGDSTGHVAAWDVSAICNAAGPVLEASMPATPAVPAVTRLAHWHAGKAAVVSLGMLDGQDLLLVGLQDSISLWTHKGGLVGVFGEHRWQVDDPTTWQDPQGLAVPPPLPADVGTGLTPRDIIAQTPRRSWAVGGGSGAVSCGSTSACRLDGAQGSSQPWAYGGHGSQAGEQEPASSVEGLARTLSRISQLCLQPPEVAPTTGSGSTSKGGMMAVAGKPPCNGVGVGGAAASGVASSAGAKLAALAAEATAAKAERWSIPVSVQPHSVLPLQQMEEVPHDTAGMWAQVKAYHGSGEREHQSRAAATTGQPGRINNGPSSGVAAIMGRGLTAFGRRVTQGHLRQ